jgi:hypothetical protein
MPLTEDNIRFQLTHLYGALEAVLAHQHTTKKWCLTVWLAILAAIFSGNITGSTWEKLFITVLPVATFWLYEGLSGGQILLWEERVLQLERLLATGASGPTDPLPLFYRTGHYSIPLKKKLMAFTRAVFLMETVFVFYVFLCVLSVVAVLLEVS